MTADFLPYGRPVLDDTDRQAVLDVLQSPFLTTGPKVPEFERAFAKQVKAPHSIACATGTAALHMAAHGIDLGPGDSAIVPTITFAATANAVRMTGADVVFADVDRDTALITPETLEAAIKSAPKPPKAVFVVHYAGQIADMAALRTLGDAHNMRVIEDACHAVGGFYAAGQPVGSAELADATTFSFHPVKTIAAGEGGMVTTRDPDLAARMRRFAGHGIERDPARFTSLPANAPWAMEVQESGPNYRMSDIHAALGISQLYKLTDFVHQRQALMSEYNRLLAPLAPVIKPLAQSLTGTPAWHLCCVLIDFQELGKTRAEVIDILREKAIGSQVHYIPLHHQPAFNQTTANLPGAEAFYARCLSLPLFPSMTKHDVARVIDALSALSA